MPDDRRRHVPRKPPPAAPDDRRRRLDALRRLAERPGTPAEGEAALAAIERITHQRHPAEPDIRFTNDRKPPSPSAAHLFDVLAGLRIQLERTPDRLRYCCRQGCIAVLDDARPTYDLRCDHCGRHLGVLPTRVSDQLAHWLGQGRLSSCPIIKDAALVR